MARISLPHQDHYEIARDRGAEELRRRLDAERLRGLGVEVSGGGGLVFASLCWRFALTPDPFSMVLLPEGRECSIVWQILALNYLNADPPQEPGRFVSFAQFAESRGYLPVFDGRVTGRLSGTVGREAQGFIAACEHCAGTQGTSRPLGYLFHLFPRFELQVVRHEGDEDFPPACNVLFPDTALEVLSAESMIVAAERLVSSLQGECPCD
jgi:hypothetical protein